MLDKIILFSASMTFKGMRYQYFSENNLANCLLVKSKYGQIDH